MNKNGEISIVLCGEAGQGIQTVELALTRTLKFAGYNVYATKEYMSRVRGGANSTELRVSSNRVNAFVDRIDILITLNKGSASRQADRIAPETIVIGEKENIRGLEERLEHVHDVRFTQIAKDIGSTLYSNIVAAGVINGLLDVEPEILETFLKERFGKKEESIIKANIKAGKEGIKIGEELRKSGKVKIAIDRNKDIKGDMLLSGIEAVAMGAIAGGCNFVSFYPMSPSTGVAVFLAQHAREFGIIVEQVEDEIAGINMAIGAWYAGARGLATTSGGGFALMEEGLSLAGSLETPIVIHIAQRPGPATGLPTRTEQSDLELALYAGHGEFPRIILTPGTNEEAFYLTQKAFNLADKFQSPVFVLTDQHLVDSYYNIAGLELKGLKNESHIIKTEQDYVRYRFTENGISPRGIPAYGKGFVCVDSDEHGEKGKITEDFGVRTKMVQKRLKKLEGMKAEIVPPELVGSRDFKTLIVGWGSTYNEVKEALGKIDHADVAFLHYKQVYPLHPDTASYLNKAKNVIVIENNATSQFGKLIKLSTGFDIKKKILKYNGMPFSVEEVQKAIKAHI